MFRWKRDDSQSASTSRSRYIEYILLFGIAFTTLQISDLALTEYGLRDPEVRELNPLYHQDWFVPFKLIMVFPIMATMYRQPVQYQGLTKSAMAGMIVMYVLINLNNLYYILR